MMKIWREGEREREGGDLSQGGRGEGETNLARLVQLVMETTRTPPSFETLLNIAPLLN